MEHLPQYVLIFYNLWVSIGENLIPSAEAFEMSRMTPLFQAVGMEDDDQQALYRSISAAMSDGHFFRTVYGIWSWGFGVDLDLDLSRTSWISSLEILSSLNGCVGDWAVGSHSGRRNSLGVEL